MNFGMLVGPEGQTFIKQCREAGKEVCVWTVNDPNEMRTAMTWGIKAVLTDKVAGFVSLKAEVSSICVLSDREIVDDPSKIAIPGLAGYLFPWSKWRYYSASHVCLDLLVRAYLRSHGSLAATATDYDPTPTALDSPTIGVTSTDAN